MSAKALAVGAGVVALGAVAVRLGPPDPRASWVPGPLSRLVLSLQDYFDRHEGIGVLCADRASKPVSFGGRVADVPSCWKVEHGDGEATLTDPDLDTMPVTVEVTAPGRALSEATVTTSVAEKVRAPVLSDEHVWIWSDGASELRASVAVPRFSSLSPKVRTHLDSIDAAVRSLR